jgi:hypothetical protein
MLFSAKEKLAMYALALTKWLVAVLPGPDKHSWPHSPKTTAILEAFTATYQKFAAA